MKKVYVFTIFACILFNSCVTNYTPPVSKNIEKKKEFNKSFDIIWEKIIKWLNENAIPIKNIDKNSGFISSEYDLTVFSDYMDCGDGGIQTDKKGTINIVVSKNNDKIIVTIITFFSCYLQYIELDKSKNDRVECISNGNIEKEIFDYINN